MASLITAHFTKSRKRPNLRLAEVRAISIQVVGGTATVLDLRFENDGDVPANLVDLRLAVIHILHFRYETPPCLTCDLQTSPPVYGYSLDLTNSPNDLAGQSVGLTIPAHADGRAFVAFGAGPGASYVARVKITISADHKRVFSLTPQDILVAQQPPSNADVAMAPDTSNPTSIARVTEELSLGVDSAFDYQDDLKIVQTLTATHIAPPSWLGPAHD